MEVNVNSKKWFLVLTALSLLAVVGTAGCTTAAPVTPAVKPVISSFAASPSSISQGDQSTISWSITGATEANIQPDIGSVGLTGSLTLSPAATATYTLTASNPAGSASSSTTINVTPVVVGLPDLVITDITLSGSEVDYVIKNVGTAESGQTTTDMYLGYIDQGSQKVNWLKQTEDFVDKLAPGEQRTQHFDNYDWRLISTNFIEAKFETYNVRVCANAEHPIPESNTTNNCKIVVWGQSYTYDFLININRAKWTSSEGQLLWPMSQFDMNGSVSTISYSPIIVLCPPQDVSKGWIIGKFGDFFVDPTSHAANVRDIEIPVQAQFTSKVGFGPGVNSPDGVTVALGYYDLMGTLVFFDKMNVQSDGQMHDYNVDLSSLAGTRTQFVLWVQANGSPEGTCVRWLSPRLSIQGQL
jgi:CARDB